MQESSKQNYLHGAAIIAAGVVVIKILGAIYKIPLGNILGDEGYGYFSVAYNIYNVFLTMATAGMPVALSRMISEADTLGRPMQARKIFRVAWLTFAIIGLILGLVMFLFPTELAGMLNNVRAAQSIWALSPALVLVYLTSTYRGYAQGMSNMKPTTISQILEVVGKVTVGLVLAWSFTRAGKSLPVASAGAIFGVTAGGAFALIYIAIYKHRHYPDKPAADPDVPESAGRILGTLLRISIPIALGSSVLSIINLIDTKLIMYRLQTALGYSETYANVLYGVYGKVQTLYNLPAAFVTPMTISIVPAIAAMVVQKKYDQGHAVAESALRISAAVAMPMGIGLAVLSDPIVNVLYPRSNAAGPTLLFLLGIASVFVCISLITTAVLQATGHELCPVWSMLAGGAAKVAVNWFLIAVPELNIVGAPVGTLACYVVICIVNYIFLCRTLHERLHIGRCLARPLLSTLIMAVVAWGVYTGLAAVMGGGLSWKRTALAMLVSMVCAVVTYLVAVVKTHAITLADLQLIPKGEKLAKVLHIR